MAAVWLETHGKAVLVKGDTMMIKDLLKAKGGKWNGGLKSWLFPGSKKAGAALTHHTWHASS
ncbi:SUB1 [Symbiodinium pilosum]|uniref:SUB1 protein n=1 Tax=Symbiodinium pilosum TaxID=2952 RepID=A0A812VZM3_SYMPI|nr:SUB1 [Symbiodinium pilosum]